MSCTRAPRHFRGLLVSVILLTALLPAQISRAGAAAPPPVRLPAPWQLSGVAGARLVTDATVDYAAGTWNVKTGPSRSAIVYQSRDGDISVVMKVTDGSGAANAHIGIMMWSSLAYNAGKAGLLMDPQAQKIYFSWDEASDRGSFFANFVQAEGIGFPVWLKLTRLGSWFTAAYSKDGRQWRPVGVPVKTFWAGKRPEIYAGIYGDSVSEQRITDLQILPATGTLPVSLPEGWKAEIQGQPDFVGEALFADGRWSLSGASAIARGGYHNTTVMKPMTSKSQITAKVRTADLADRRAFGGLVFSAHDVDAGVLVSPASAQVTVFTRKSSTGQWLNYRNLPLPAPMAGQPESWLRVALADGKMAAFFSMDAKDWTQLADTFPVNELSSDITGGMEFFCDSGTRFVSTAGFAEVQHETIDALPIKAPVVAVAAVAPRAAPAAPMAQNPAPQPRPIVVQPYVQPRASFGQIAGGLACPVTVLLLIVIFVCYRLLINPYNLLVTLRNATLKAWSDIDIQLKRRHDLIANYVETVKGYAKHERGTLEGVTQARSAAVSASTVEERAKAEAALNTSMRSLYAVVEAYPELKADRNFTALQDNLKDTEDKLAKARVDYNNVVLSYNNKAESFPSNLIALVFRFKTRAFFEVEDSAHRDAPKVSM